MLEMILSTILKRPYVLAFLLSYIYIAFRTTSGRFSFLYFLIGYTIAWVSEYLSINYGFPYGWYFYKYENLAGEWLNHGVPVWDSASYVFMNFAGLCMATLTLGISQEKMAPKIKLILLSAFFVMLLDVVIDPVSHMGARWFLGEIYYYPEPGWYFDITMANFAGWFLVSLLINGTAVYALGFLQQIHLEGFGKLSAIGLYYGIFSFGLVIAIYLQEWLLVCCDIFWIGLTGVLITRRSKMLSHRDCL